ncbi:hypothetical protein Droror1_Dr00027396 [Drosera rotundifolia]
MIEIAAAIEIGCTSTARWCFGCGEVRQWVARAVAFVVSRGGVLFFDEFWWLRRLALGSDARCWVASGEIVCVRVDWDGVGVGVVARID